MTDLSLVIWFVLFFPVALAGAAKLLSQFCEIKADSIVALGFCVGGVCAMQTGFFPIVVRQIYLVHLQGSAMSIMLHAGKVLSIMAVLSCVITIAMLSFELPARWIMKRGEVDVLPWSFIRTLLIVLCVSSTLGWLSDLLIRSV